MESKIIDTRAPRWVNAARTLVDIEVHHAEHGWIPFTASPDDPMDYGRVLFQAALDGELGEIAEYVAPVKTAAELKADKLTEINAECEKAIAAIKAGYPESEVLSWPKQEAEARAFIADPVAATPLLDALAAARAMDKAELAARVVAKADAFAAYSGQIIGKRQGLEDALDALPEDATAEQIAGVVW